MRSTALRYRPYEWIFRFFCSLKLTVVVLSLLFFACFVGMFWDQTLSYEQHVSGMSASSIWAKIIWGFELYDVFHSWWFSIVVVLLALNLIACSIERLPKVWIDVRYPHKYLTERLLAGMPLRTTFHAHTRDKALHVLANVFPRFSMVDTRDDVTYVFAEKHKYSRTGVYVVHVALLMIMFGSIATTNFGLDGFMNIAEGESSRYLRVKGVGGLPYFHDLGFEVGCADFRLTSFVDDTPMEFESDLLVTDPDLKEPLKKTIRVNDPLFYKGFTFYQASYQPLEGEETIRFGLAPHGKDPVVSSVALGQRVTAPDGTFYVPLEIAHNYGGLGPALRVQKITPGGTPTSFFVFRQYPDFDKTVRRDNWDIYFQGFDRQYITGISVGKAPFLPFVFFGCFWLLVGIFMAFCMHHRRYYARIQLLDGGEFEVTVAASARRHKQALEEQFVALVGKMKDV